MVFGLLRVKDEADVIERTIRHTLEQVDHLIVADNGSTDGTREIASAFPVELVDDTEVGYYQAAALTDLAGRAWDDGATWVVSVDADELWYPKDGGRLADLLAGLPPDALIAEATVLDHVAVDGHVWSPYRRTQTLPLRKVACRAREGLSIHQGNHSADYAGVRTPLTVTGQLEVRHFPHRSPEQMIRKARNGGKAYAATDLPEEVGAHWRGWNRLTDAQIREVFFEFYFSADPENDPDLVFDPAPEAACATS